MNKKLFFISMVVLVSILTTIASLLGCGDLGSAFIFVVTLNSIALIILGSTDHLWKHNKTS